MDTCELRNANTLRAPKVLFCTDLNLSNADTLWCELALPGSSFGRSNITIVTVVASCKRLESSLLDCLVLPSRCHGQLCQSSNAYNKDRVPTGVSITLNAYSLSCVIKNCKRPKIYLATTLTTTGANNAFNSIASLLLFTELHVE